MKAGFSKVDITPDIALLGSYRYSCGMRAQGVHDPLFARWMVLENGPVRWALLSIDVVYLETHESDKWRREFAAVSGIPCEAITLACTHTHNGPNLCDDPKVCDPLILQKTFSFVRDALREAIGHLKPARLGWVEAEYGHAINRHERSAGRGDKPIDPVVSVLLVSSGDKPLGHVIHFAAHPTVAKAVGGLISGDYPATLLQETEWALGGVGLFLLGAAGNINLEIEGRSYERAEFHGRNLADQCIRAAEICRFHEHDDLSLSNDALSASSRPDLPLRASLVRQIDELEQEEARFIAGHPEGDVPGRIWNRRRLLKLSLREMEKLQPRVTVPIQCVRVAGRACVFSPGEWFVEFAQRLRQSFPGMRPLWVNCANGYTGYIPTEKTYREKGTYVNQPGFINRLEEGAGERLFADMLPLLSRLRG